jgi:hypothetical protein
MPAHDISDYPLEELPTTSGAYLVRLGNYQHLSDYLGDFVISDYLQEFRQFRLDLYMGDEGTLEPTDITDLVQAWWHLPR